MNLVTLRQARHQVGVNHHDDDVLLEEKRFQASSIILDYLKLYDSGNYQSLSDFASWFDAFEEPTSAIPGVITAATLIVVGALYENRDGTDDNKSPQTLSRTVVDLLMRRRDPSMA